MTRGSLVEEDHKAKGGGEGEGTLTSREDETREIGKEERMPEEREKDAQLGVIDRTTSALKAVYSSSLAAFRSTTSGKKIGRGDGDRAIS